MATSRRLRGAAGLGMGDHDNQGIRSSRKRTKIVSSSLAWHLGDLRAWVDLFLDSLSLLISQCQT